MASVSKCLKALAGVKLYKDPDWTIAGLGSCMRCILMRGPVAGMHQQDSLQYVRNANLCDFVSKGDQEGGSVLDNLCNVLVASPTRPGVMVATAGSGHSFKFTLVLGDVIADIFEKNAASAVYGDVFRWRTAKKAGVELQGEEGRVVKAARGREELQAHRMAHRDELLAGKL
ncbi:hypothetical protein SmJEL517_g05202 [Synchytrium microbalum]|uniref:Uncharacterized protein n=1 Tax=Synchytrium microbalum TaxID=1806994 RepID=A0A507C1R1_9FUNG|nr:uncharacterized protein SmJEL517_g05202 [Synchytrium microbalum]TPX31465.1 hypothetical protein SmJEL517_g05202 [Synchytrium microbalum]